MTQRVVVDPITRIEGHLRIEAETAADGVDHQRLSPRAPWCAGSS